jgi:hypothetical protein
MRGARSSVFGASIAAGLVVACGGGDDATVSLVEAGTDAATDGAPPADSAPGIDVFGIDTGVGRTTQCGQTSCDAASQDCCLGAGATGACATKATCTGSSLACSGTASCPAGNICCVSVVRMDAGADGGSNATIHSQCLASCPKGETQLCAESAECPSGDECARGASGLKECRRALDAGRG